MFLEQQQRASLRRLVGRPGGLRLSIRGRAGWKHGLLREQYFKRRAPLAGFPVSESIRSNGPDHVVRALVGAYVAALSTVSKSARAHERICNASRALSRLGPDQSLVEMDNSILGKWPPQPDQESSARRAACPDRRSRWTSVRRRRVAAEWDLSSALAREPHHRRQPDARLSRGVARDETATDRMRLGPQEDERPVALFRPFAAAFAERGSDRVLGLPQG